MQTLQSDFPLVPKPYDKIAEKLKIDTDLLMARIKALMSDGIIRRLGASLNSQKLGYRSTLAAVSIKQSDIARACELIDGFAEITHSYLRNDKFNIWFTIIAPDIERIQQILEQIQSPLALKNSQMLNLPAERLFKLNACFGTACDNLP